MAQTLKAYLQGSVKDDNNSNLPFVFNASFEQDCLYAYSQEFRLDGSEAPIVIAIDGSPDYDDMVFMRVEMLDSYAGNATPIVKVNSTNGSYMSAYLQPEVGFQDICGTDWWTDDSTSDPDIITSVELSLAGSIGSCTIRVTAYFNAS